MKTSSILTVVFLGFLLISCSNTKTALQTKTKVIDWENLKASEQKAIDYLSKTQQKDGSFHYFKSEDIAMETPVLQKGILGTINVLYAISETEYKELPLYIAGSDYLQANKVTDDLWSRESKVSKAYFSSCALPPDIHSSAYTNLILNNTDTDGFNQALKKNKSITSVGLYNYFLNNDLDSSFCDFANWRELSLYENLKVLQWQKANAINDPGLFNDFIKLATESDVWQNDSHYGSAYYFAYLMVKSGSDTIAKALLPNILPALLTALPADMSTADLAFYTRVLMYVDANIDDVSGILFDVVEELKNRQQEDGKWLVSPFFYNRKPFKSKESEQKWIENNLVLVRNHLLKNGVESLSKFDWVSLLGILSYQAKQTDIVSVQLLEYIEKTCAKKDYYKLMLPLALVKYCNSADEDKQQLMVAGIAELAELVSPYYYGSTAETTAYAIEALAAFRKKYAEDKK